MPRKSGYGEFGRIGNDNVLATAYRVHKASDLWLARRVLWKSASRVLRPAEHIVNPAASKNR